MSQSFRVLLVEDDESLRSCLGDFLAGHGWEVAATAYGTEAMAMAHRLRFDFTILDFHLPEMTGLELFRSLASIRPLPGILMSGLASAEEAAAARHAGFFTFLRKPLELERLRQSVQQLIQTHFGGPMMVFPGRPAARHPGHSSNSSSSKTPPSRS
ncbi:MAG: response regulator [Planctomycetes bacterium]|nr:response regulator [Planctomycetota bacterium]